MGVGKRHVPTRAPDARLRHDASYFHQVGGGEWRKLEAPTPLVLGALAEAWAESLHKDA